MSGDNENKESTSKNNKKNISLGDSISCSTGFAAATALTATQKHAPKSVISRGITNEMLSGATDPIQQAAGVAVGAVMFRAFIGLVKPFISMIAKHFSKKIIQHRKSKIQNSQNIHTQLETSQPSQISAVETSISQDNQQPQITQDQTQDYDYNFVSEEEARRKKKKKLQERTIR